MLNENILENIEENYTHSSHTFQAISDVILNFGDNKFNLTIKELSKLAFCAESTIIQYVKFLGFDSFTVFKHELNNTVFNKYSLIKESFDLAQNSFNNSDFKKKLKQELKKTDKVFIFASGHSASVAYDFYLKVFKMDKNKFIFTTDEKVQLTYSSFINKDSVVIFISNSGRSKKFINLSKNIESKKTYLITNRQNSPLAHTIKNTISMNNNFEPTYMFNEFPTTSKYSLIYFLDLLFDYLYS